MTTHLKQGDKPKKKKHEMKITQISFDAHIVAEIYDYGQGISMMKVLEMLNSGEFKIKTPDIILNKPVIILRDKTL